MRRMSRRGRPWESPSTAISARARSSAFIPTVMTSPRRWRPTPARGGFAPYYMYTKHPVSGPPDQDGVWAAYYVNPDPAFGWPARINSYYAPLVLSAPLTVTAEVVTTHSATIAAGAVVVFDTLNAPVDDD